MSENLLGMKNGDLLDIFKQNKWILITHDQDFLNPPKKDHLGIIVVRIHPATDSIAGIILEKYLKSIDQKDIEGKLVVLEKKSWKYKT